MKKTIRIMGVIFLSLLTVLVRAQEPTTPQTQPQPVVTTQTWDSHKNPTVDSINAKYRDKMVAAPSAYTTDMIFPIIGKYESSTNTEVPVITISIDETNHGIAWIDGLPQGRVKGLLRKSPAVYKIPAQKTEEGKDVAEGTLIYDKDQNTLNIILGKDFNTEDPASAFTVSPEPETVAVTKTKAGKSKVKKVVAPKPWLYTATKVGGTTAAVTQ
jgi:hypothetical protein